MPALWSLVPNWKTPLRVSHEFLTEIIASRSGKEQRRALRETARRKLSYDALVENDSLRLVNGLLARLRSAPMDVPDFSAGVLTTSAMASASATLAVDRIPTWLTAGAEVALVAGRRVEKRTVDAISGLNITFEETADAPWHPKTRICPLLSGRPAGDMRSTRITNAVGPLDVELALTPATETPDEGGVDFRAYFNGREVFMARPNWTTSPTVSYLNPVETVDFGRGVVAFTQAVDHNSQTRTATYLHRSAAEADVIRQFFNRMKGQRGEFYLPTWENDIALAQDVAAGTTDLLTVTGSELFHSYADDPTHRAIAVTMTSGFVFFREIEGIVLDGDDSVIVLRDPWPFDVPTADVRFISWMPVVRFATDTLTVEWVTDQVAQAVLSFRNLPAEPVEAGAVDLDAAALYMISTFGWDFTDQVLVNPLRWAMNVRLPEIFE